MGFPGVSGKTPRIRCGENYELGKHFARRREVLQLVEVRVEKAKTGIALPDGAELLQSSVIVSRLGFGG